LANLQAARELKIARKAILEAELKSLSAEIEADDKKIAELPGLIEKIQEEATSAVAEVNQCNAELAILSDAQKDYQERMENIHQTTVGEFRKTRHPRNVELNKVLKACFSRAGNSQFLEAWNLRSLEFANVQSSEVLIRQGG
jgi:chromosome segregation ATPase